MKKATLLIAAFLCIASAASAQNKLTDILNKIAGKTATTTTETTTTNTGKSGSVLSDAINTIAGILGNNKVTEKDLVGTWLYKGSAVSFKSENDLADLASGIAESTIEKKIDPYLEKAGIKEGNFAITFNEDGTMKLLYGKKTFNGNWKYDQENATVTMTMAKLVSNKAIVSISGGQLKLLFDSTTLMNLIKKLARKNSSSVISAIASVAESYTEMYTGFKMQK